MKNKFGVPYHPYKLKLSDDTTVEIDVGDESDWGNIQRCYTDWDGKEHRPCVGWGDAVEWTEIIEVLDIVTGDIMKPLDWAEKKVWCHFDNYCE